MKDVRTDAPSHSPGAFLPVDGPAVEDVDGVEGNSRSSLLTNVFVQVMTGWRPISARYLWDAIVSNSLAKGGRANEPGAAAQNVGQSDAEPGLPWA
mmetsp:Transcript_82711/g.230659  ORF Transcript_82711/g.230659 Transcript_82711/m.230659 type:complete len:96 (+) Transcript_82711:3010-3297(+)